MFRVIAATGMMAALAACQTFDGTEQTAGQTVRVAHTKTGGTLRQFRLADGTRMNVIAEASQVRVMHLISSHPSAAEVAHYVHASTGCLPGAVLQSYTTTYNHARNTVYALSCGG